MFWNYLNMSTGLVIALANVFNSAFQGSMRWVIVGCGLLIFIYNLIVTFNQKQNEASNQNTVGIVSRKGR
ncbi:hypothetical protein PQ796_18775 [Priestia megaterium]|uniref:hypothetical protein n=1 Tax=Priestia TaxID=2800373 RepID=UPI00070F5B1E|nr:MULTISPECIES: hypothetical protein [Priestia]KRF55916.1 hypothetical protein ASG98_02475 [Bacillus sp. Soil531]MDH2452587.1 hypothetical protein [Priestia megaterium]MDL5152044.1 hypothetical protein [Priestia megaterium]MDP9723554.1 uncharacterized membrane protein YoaT (DUF817 family) [Priestia aryabhattai]MED3872343.1 hypothetical protein [Priestia megaterium]